ncbi:hypothetical protein D9757_012879 [Collybiopsis confluens]|uniref:DUF6534 domain-containing protein n=1 Tax=Collybiopsis confluens TaxID=2823264 RepID=A0A8H5FWL7_9AGAR|nr:hypothetical protein D9757_012879 [Collybiopsis confluens]
MNSTMFSRVDLLLRSLQPLESYIGNKMKQSINAFSTPEEARLQINLEGVDYDIDSPETVAIVTGPGRIERFVLPLLYLLLKRHLKVFYLAQTHIIDEEEFRDMTISLKNVFEILDARIKNLSTVLEQAIHDVAGRLSTFAFGLIRLTYIDPTRRPKDSSLRPWNEEGKEEGKGAVVGSEKMSLEAISKIPVSILKYGNKDTLESSIYQHSSTLFHVHDRQPRPPRHRISGYWAGHLWTKNLDELYSDEGLMQVSIIEVNQEGGIAGSAETYHGLMTVSGNISSNGTLCLKFVYEDGTTIECNGQFNIRAHTLSGGFFFTKSDDEDEGGDRNLLGYGSDDSDDDKIREGSDSSDEESSDGSNNGQGTTDAERSKPRNQIGTFIFNRTPAAAWRFHTPFGGTSKSARERWAFAIAAVLDEVKRTNFSMGFIRERNAERKRFLDLLVRRETHHKFNLSPTNCLSNAEGRELRLLTAKIHPADARFYYSLVKSQIEASSVRHLGCLCNNCGRGIIQTKFLCVACINADHSETLDFADEKSDKTKLLDMEISCCCCGTEVNLPCWLSGQNCFGLVAAAATYRSDYELASYPVQVFYAHRMTVFGKSSYVTRIIGIIVVVLGLFTFITAIIAGVTIVQNQSGNGFLNSLIFEQMWLASSSACDVIITTTMIYLLKKSNSEVKETRMILSRMVRILVESGFITVILFIADFCLFVAFPSKIYHIAICNGLVNAHGITLLIILNSRSRLIGSTTAYNPKSNWDVVQNSLHFATFPSSGEGQTRGEVQTHDSESDSFNCLESSGMHDSSTRSAGTFNAEVVV